MRKKKQYNLSQLETKRCILRKLSMSDAKDIFEYGFDPKVSKYTTWETHKTIKDTKAFLKSLQKKYRQGCPDWGIWHKGDKKIIGTIGFVNWDEMNRSAEIGYAISRKYWGKELVVECIRPALTYVFSKRKMKRIVGRCLARHKRSSRVLEKSGFVFEGNLRKSVLVRGRYEDIRVYSILREDWIKLRSKKCTRKSINSIGKI